MAILFKNGKGKEKSTDELARDITLNLEVACFKRTFEYNSVLFLNEHKLLLLADALIYGKGTGEK